MLSSPVDTEAIRLLSGAAASSFGGGEGAANLHAIKDGVTSTGLALLGVFVGGQIVACVLAVAAGFWLVSSVADDFADVVRADHPEKWKNIKDEMSSWTEEEGDGEPVLPFGESFAALSLCIAEDTDFAMEVLDRVLEAKFGEDGKEEGSGSQP
jgi:hypothetical protein